MHTHTIDPVADGIPAPVSRRIAVVAPPGSPVLRRLDAVLGSLGWTVTAHTAACAGAITGGTAAGPAVVVMSDDTDTTTLHAICAARATVLLFPAPDPPSPDLGAVAVFAADVDPATWATSLPLWIRRRDPPPPAPPADTVVGGIEAARRVHAAVGLLAERHRLPVRVARERLVADGRSRHERVDEAADRVLATHHHRLDTRQA